MPEILDVAGDRLDAGDLYRLLRLRAEVFVVEQACCYLDPDGADVLATTRHLWIEGDAPTPLSALRVLRGHAGETRIGRVVTRSEARGRGLAATLLRRALDSLDGPVVLGAQAHLAAWYGAFGFAVDGAEYLEDGIPHLPMRRP